MKNNNILTKVFAPAAALLVLAAAAHAATLVNGTSGAGELFVGFRVASDGSQKNVVYDLGSAAGFSALSTGSVVSLGNIGADLVAQYGSNWYENTGLTWGAVSGNNGTDIGANTLYGGVAGTGSFPLGTAGYTRVATNAQASVVTQILTMATGFIGASTGLSGSSVAIENTTDANSWTSRFGSSPFNGFANPTGQAFEQAFTTGTLASGYEAALDVYRMVRTTVTDPDTGLTSGAGSYQLTLAIDSTGALTGAVLPVAVPEPATIGSLFSAGLLGICAVRRRRGAKA